MEIGKNQYVLVPKDYNLSYENVSERINGYCLYLGEDCHYTKVERNEVVLLMIGYAVDAMNETSSEKDICENLLFSYISDNKSLLYNTRNLGGRWALFYFEKNEVVALNDACAFRQIYYSLDNDNAGFASQARYLADIFHYSPDKEALSYITDAKQQNKEYSWPLDKTLYKEIKRLLPNHIYRAGAMPRVSREFNEVKEYKKTYNEAAIEYNGLISKSLLSLSRRGRIAVTLTAGLDSRVVLSCCEKIKKEIKVITFKYATTSYDVADVLVPQVLCNKLGFKHLLVECNTADANFKKRYYESNEDAHDYWMQIPHALEQSGLNDHYIVKGSCNEIVNRCNGILNNNQINEEILSKMFRLPATGFVLSAISEWLVSAREYCKLKKMNLLDLFYWEHRMGSWCAASMCETDLVCETFAPFNLRSYLEDIYQMPINKLTPPSYKFYRAMLTIGGNSYLSSPINENKDKLLSRRLFCFIKYHCHSIYHQVVMKKKNQL